MFCLRCMNLNDACQLEAAFFWIRPLVHLTQCYLHWLADFQVRGLFQLYLSFHFKILAIKLGAGESKTSSANLLRCFLAFPGCKNMSNTIEHVVQEIFMIHFNRIKTWWMTGLYQKHSCNIYTHRDHAYTVLPLGCTAQGKTTSKHKNFTGLVLVSFDVHNPPMPEL